MQDDTALYGAKMMQPGMTAADSEENNLRCSGYEGQLRGIQNFLAWKKPKKEAAE